jgi:hypothetical protein
MYLAALGNAIEAQLSLDSVHLFIVPLFHANSWIFPYAVTAIAGKALFVALLAIVSGCLKYVHESMVFLENGGLGTAKEHGKKHKQSKPDSQPTKPSFFIPCALSILWTIGRKKMSPKLYFLIYSFPN